VGQQGDQPGRDVSAGPSFGGATSGGSAAAHQSQMTRKSDDVRVMSTTPHGLIDAQIAEMESLNRRLANYADLLYGWTLRTIGADESLDKQLSGSAPAPMDPPAGRAHVVARLIADGHAHAQRIEWLLDRLGSI
jgi:hypothetical protein